MNVKEVRPVPEPEWVITLTDQEAMMLEYILDRWSSSDNKLNEFANDLWEPLPGGYFLNED